MIEASANYNSEIFSIKSAIERMGKNIHEAFRILSRHRKLLIDMKYVYSSADMTGKRNFVKMVFDSNLYYLGRIYRTPTMAEMFTDNSLKIKDKELLILKKRGI